MFLSQNFLDPLAGTIWIVASVWFSGGRPGWERLWWSRESWSAVTSLLRASDFLAMKWEAVLADGRVLSFFEL